MHTTICNCKHLFYLWTYPLLQILFILSSIMATNWSLAWSCIILLASCWHWQVVVNATTTTTASNRLPQPADRIRDEPQSVWVEFIQLALDHKPLNLGQGFPDFAAPPRLVESLRNATSQVDRPTTLSHQYTRSFGHPRLVRALTDYYHQFRHFEELQGPNEQVLVTVGAYEALFCAVMAFVGAGDQVLIIDPAFDAYAPMVRMAGGSSVFIPLKPQQMDAINSSSSSQSWMGSEQFKLDFGELEAKMNNNRTKMLILNTPNNPLGKIYTQQELGEIARLCRKHNLLVVADEVYEHFYYTGWHHESIARLPGMFERTITIGSAGKTFSVTGWKVGWALGPAHLMRYLQLVHQTAVYTVATPLQEALARQFEEEMHQMRQRQVGYWPELREDLAQKRTRMAGLLAKGKMAPIIPQGGYFMMANFSQLAQMYDGQYQKLGRGDDGAPQTNDYLFARWLSREKHLQGIPGSAFYSTPENKLLAAHLIRFCFIKSNETLDRLEQLLEGLPIPSVVVSGGPAVSTGR